MTTDHIAVSAGRHGGQRSQNSLQGNGPKRKGPVASPPPALFLDAQQIT
jgi:hypothetical protein